jgi:hypothetical protein
MAPKHQCWLHNSDIQATSGSEGSRAAVQLVQLCADYRQAMLASTSSRCIVQEGLYIYDKVAHSTNTKCKKGAQP